MNKTWSAVCLCSLFITATGATADSYSFEVDFPFKDNSIWAGGAVNIGADETVSKPIGSGAAVLTGAGATTGDITAIGGVSTGASNPTNTSTAGHIISVAAVTTGANSVVKSISAGGGVSTGAGAIVGAIDGPYGDIYTEFAATTGAESIVGNIYAGAAVTLGIDSQSGKVNATGDITASFGSVFAESNANDAASSDNRPPIVVTSAADGIAVVAEAQRALSGLTADHALPAVMTNMTFKPGVHTSLAAAGTAAGAEVTFDSDGEDSPLWIFNINGALAVGAGTTFKMSDVPAGGRVIWNINGAIALGAGTTFIGTAFVNGAVGPATADVCGTLFAVGGVIIGSVTSTLGDYDCSYALKDLVIDDDDIVDPVDPIIDHYELERNQTSGLTCEPMTITSRACLNADCTQQVSGAVISTAFSPISGWIGSSTKTDYSSGAGFAFQHTTPGTVTLAVGASTPEIKTAAQVKCFVGATLQPNCNVTFTDTALRFFTAAEGVASIFSTPNGMADLLAGDRNPDALFMRAIETDEATGQCQTHLLPSKTVSAEIGTVCNTPGSCLVGHQVRWQQGGNTPLSLANPQDRVASSNTSATNVLFGANGTAEFTLHASDIGLQNVNVNISLANADGIASGRFISGTLPLRVRPASLVITSVDATDPHVAGDPFSLRIHALGDTGAVVPGFGRFTDYAVNWARSSVAEPVGGHRGSLFGDQIDQSTADQWVGLDTDIDGDTYEESITFSAGNGLAYHEVGTVNLVAQIEDFMGSSNDVESPGVLVGRFIPAYLTATQVGIAAWGPTADGPLMYQGQPRSLTALSYQVRAFSMLPPAPAPAPAAVTLLQNYTRDDLVEESENPQGPHENVIKKPTDQDLTGGDLESQLTWTVTRQDNEDFNGILTLNAIVPELTWQRNPTGPTDADRLINLSNLQLDSTALTDDDSVCVQLSADTPCVDSDLAIDDKDLVYVRAALPAQVDGTTTAAFIDVRLERLDRIEADNPIFVVHTIDNSLDNTIIIGLDFDADRDTCTLASAADCSAIAEASSFTGPNGIGTTLTQGLGLITASAQTPVSGIMSAHLNAPAWLGWDWDGDGDEELASTVIIFGDFQGRQPMLFTRPGSR